MEQFIFHSGKENKNRVTVVGKFENNQLKVAVARCSDRDNFCRRTGRNLASARLYKNQMYTVISTDTMDGRRFKNYALVIAKELQQGSKVIRLQHA